MNLNMIGRKTVTTDTPTALVVQWNSDKMKTRLTKHFILEISVSLDLMTHPYAVY